MRTVISDGRTYLRLVQGYLDRETGQVPTYDSEFRYGAWENGPRVIALKKMYGIEQDTKLKHDSSLDFGDVFMLFGIWQQLNLEKAFLSGLKSDKKNIERTIALIRLMVFHRIAIREANLIACIGRLRKHMFPTFQTT